MKKLALLCLFFQCCFFSFSQVDSLSYALGKSLNDKYKFSNIKAIADDGEGGVVIVRSYYGGVIMHLKGYYIEHYNNKLELVNDYKYEVEDVEVMGVFVKDGFVNVIEVTYDEKRKSYAYWANRTTIKSFAFRRKHLFYFWREEKEKQINFLRDPSNIFEDQLYSQLLFNEDQSAFAITVDSKQKGKDKHLLYAFDSRMNQKALYKLEEETVLRHLVFEHMDYDPLKNEFYFLAKAYEKGKRTKTISIKYAYQLFKLKGEEIQYHTFASKEIFPSALKLVLDDRKVKCVGFYSKVGSGRFRGLVYNEFDTESLQLTKTEINPFSKQFMLDKYGAEVDKELKNLVFKDLHKTVDGGIIFNAEERYMSRIFKNNSGDSRRRVNRYHYNDIVCVKLNAQGKMVWARNINKAESTEGDEAYVSYVSASNAKMNCFFINSGAVPQKISKDRILFKKGYSRSPNLYRIDIDDTGEMQYVQVVNNKAVRLPLMVSKGTISKDQKSIFFLARRGNKKQLVKVRL